MKLKEALIKLLNEKVGYDVATVAGARKLRDEIERDTREMLSVNTIKRLFGLLPYTNEPRESTLDIFARFLGYSSWRVLIEIISDRESGFNEKESFIDAELLPEGCLVRLEWEKDRVVTLRHLQGRIFKVENALNSKLKAGDMLDLGQIAVDFPLIVKEVMRDGESLGSYSAAVTTGLKSIVVE